MKIRINFEVKNSKSLVTDFLWTVRKSKTKHAAPPFQTKRGKSKHGAPSGERCRNRELRWHANQGKASGERCRRKRRRRRVFREETTARSACLWRKGKRACTSREIHSKENTRRRVSLRLRKRRAQRRAYSRTLASGEKNRATLVAAPFGTRAKTRTVPFLGRRRENRAADRRRGTLGRRRRKQS
jgi:hypothetical protein